MSIEISYPELPEHTPWTKEQITIALVTNHPVRSSMIVEAPDDYFEASFELREKDLKENDTRPFRNGILAQIARRIARK